ncbi:MAG: DoxX family protein [bacterium]
MTTTQKVGWGLSGVFGLFMILASGLPKFIAQPMVVDIMTGLGWPDAPILLIGCLEIGLTVLYLIPATSVLGAVLLMALLGGALVTNLHAHAELFGHTLFSIYLGVLMWAGLILRDPRVRAVFPLAI